MPVTREVGREHNGGVTNRHEPSPLRDLLGNLTGQAAGHYGTVRDDDHAAATQGPLDHAHSPLKRHPGDDAEEASRPHTLPDQGGDDDL